MEARQNKLSIKNCIDVNLLCMLAAMLLGYLLIHSLIGGTLLAHNWWDSYSLQAEAWLNGRFDLGQNYEWLELAIFEGKYYVSFPPLPTLAVLPLVLIFGGNTPNNLLVAFYGMATAAFAYRALRRMGIKGEIAALGGFAYVWGCNVLWMTTCGGVWFQAQALNMLLLTWAVCLIQEDKRTGAYALIALAVGCRPFSICAFLPVAAYFFVKDKELTVRERIKKQLLPLIIPALIGGAYMWYNYARFGNILEFGHNYLPEFTEAENGQFHLSYILPNLYNLFIRPITIGEGLSLKYPVFDGFMFYIANPVYLIWFGWIARDILKKQMDLPRIAVILAVAAEILLLCAHKTLGGWQFGARYTVDMIPLILLYAHHAKAEVGGRWQGMIMLFGVMLNLYGTLAMTFLHG